MFSSSPPRDISYHTAILCSIDLIHSDGPSELASRCRFTFSCLANDDALLSVFHQYLENLPLNKSPNETEKRTYVDMSTVKPETTRHLAALAVEHGVTFIHCPVFGRPDAAAAGNLKAVISGGNKSERDLVAEMVESSFAQKGVMDLGDDPGSASAMKLVGNFYILGQIELAAECLTVGTYITKDQMVETKIYNVCLPLVVFFFVLSAFTDFSCLDLNFPFFPLSHH